MGNKRILPASFYTQTPWSQPTESLWPGSIFSIYRNCNAYPFYSTMSDLQKSQILERLQTVLAQTAYFQGGLFIPGEAITPQEQEYLYEHFVLDNGTEPLNKYQGLYLNPSANTLALINLEDHLQIRFLVDHGQEQEAFARITQLDNMLHEQLAYAFSERFGFLTAHPSHAGTGFVVQAFMHLPAHTLLQKLEESAEHLPSQLTTHSLQKTEQYLGDLVIVENRYTLGVTEEHILEALQKGTEIFIQRERELYVQLVKESPSYIKNLVARALGMLKHSYQMQAHEAIDALSLIELGRRLEWIGEIEHLQFPTMVFQCLKAHLPDAASHAIKNSDECLQSRASFLNQQYQGAKLLF